MTNKTEAPNHLSASPYPQEVDHERKVLPISTVFGLSYYPLGYLFCDGLFGGNSGIHCVIANNGYLPSPYLTKVTLRKEPYHNSLRGRLEAPQLLKNGRGVLPQAPKILTTWVPGQPLALIG